MNPNHVAMPNWLYSTEKRPIALYRSQHALTKRERGPNDLPPILIMGGVHGDEPEGINLASDTLNWLLERPMETVLPWICIPCLNVDGAFHKTRVNGNKVDLNRNYPSKNWSPKYETERYHPGPKAASEIEIQGVVRVVSEYEPCVLIHCHSWHPCIVMTGAPGRRFAEPLSRASGYELKEDIGYPTPGSLSQYGWHDLKIPVICIEEKEESARAQTWMRFKPAIEEIFSKR